MQLVTGSKIFNLLFISHVHIHLPTCLTFAGPASHTGQQLPMQPAVSLPSSHFPSRTQTFLPSAVVTHGPNLHPCHSSPERNRHREITKHHLGSASH